MAVSAAPMQVKDATDDGTEMPVPVPEQGGDADELPNVKTGQTTPEELESEISCPPGQFPSAKADVPPDHWAYTAVNRLASPPIECFEFDSN
ncbi:MAG: hypothetical protein AAFQ89_23145 [Cyanobacteria bacterium J06626_18]